VNFSISVDLAYKTAPQFEPEISRKNPSYKRINTVGLKHSEGGC